jgi:L-fuconolactonase
MLRNELARLRRSFTLADLARLAAAAGVTGTVVIQAVAEPWETPDLLALAAGRDPYQAEEKPCGPAEVGGSQPAPARGLLAGVVGWTDLTAPTVPDAVAGLRELPGGEFPCGIRHPVLVEADPGWLARPAVLRGLHALAAAGLSLMRVPAWHWLRHEHGTLAWRVRPGPDGLHVRQGHRVRLDRDRAGIDLVDQ